MTDRYDSMSRDNLVQEAKNKNISKIGDGEDATSVDDAGSNDLKDALRAFDDAQKEAGPTGDEHGTNEEADRSNQHPGAGDPKVATDTTTSSQGEGTSQLGSKRGDEN